MRRPLASRTQKPLLPSGTTSATEPSSTAPPYPVTSLAPEGEQLSGRHAVPRQEAVHVGSRGVAGVALVDHDHPAPGSGQDQGG